MENNNNKITSTELDNIINRKLKEKGVHQDISNEQKELIKEKIKNAVLKSKVKTETFNEAENAQNQTNTKPEQQNVVVSAPKSEITPATITQNTTIDKSQLEVSKKEGELNAKEQILSQREAELANKEAEFQRKQDELKYVPKIPVILENLGSEKMFVFNQAELSLGGESIAQEKFRLMSNPDEKKSLDDVWAQEGKREVEIYLAKFEKLGKIVFDPFKGTGEFIEQRFQEKEQLPTTHNDGLTPQDAIESQKPVEQMIDTVSPIYNKTLPPSDDMGLKTLDLERLVKDRVDNIIKNYFNVPKI